MNGIYLFSFIVLVILLTSYQVVITNITKYLELFFSLNFFHLIKQSNNEFAAFAQTNNNEGITPDFATGSYPVGIVVNPFTNKIYVANQFSNTLSVYDSKTDVLKNTIKTGIFPYGMDSNLFNNRIYVTNRGTNEVSVIDGSTDFIIDNITVEKSPVGIAVDPSGNWIYVTNIDSNSLSVIDGISNKVIHTIQGFNTPYGVAVNPFSKKIYVTDLANSTLTVINGTDYSVIKNVDVGSAPVGIDIDLTKNMVFVSNYLSNSLTIINGTNDTPVATVDTGKSPVGVKFNPNSNKLYVSNIESSTLSIYDGSNYKKIREVPINPSLVEEKKEYPYRIPTNVKFPLIASYIDIDPINNLVYATNTASNTLSLIDGNLDQRLVRLNFNVQPPNSGFIECNGIRNLNENSTLIPVNKTMNCNANPERGYSFNSWVGLVSGEKNPLEFTTQSYGNISAIFRTTLSTEQYIFIIGGLIGMSSALLGWFFKGGQRNKFNKFIQIVNQTIDGIDYKNKPASIVKLENLRRNIFNSYRRGSLTDFQFDFLDKKLVNQINKLNQMESQ